MSRRAGCAGLGAAGSALPPQPNPQLLCISRPKFCGKRGGQAGQLRRPWCGRLSPARPAPPFFYIFGQAQSFEGGRVSRRAGCAGLGAVGSALPPQPTRVFFSLLGPNFVGSGAGRQVSCAGLGAAGSALPAPPRLLSMFLGRHKALRSGGRAGGPAAPALVR